MSKSSSSGILTIILVIVVVANPWVLKVAFSSLLVFLLWLVGILVVFSIMGYIVNMICFDKNQDGEPIKSTKLEMLAKVILIPAIALAPIFFINKSLIAAYTFAALLLVANVLFVISDKLKARRVVN